MNPANAPLGGAGPIRGAFLAADDDRGVRDLREHHDQIDLVYAQWSRLEGGRLAAVTGQNALRTVLVAEGMPAWVPVVAVDEDIDGMLTASLRARVVVELMECARQAGGRGLCLDLSETIPGTLTTVPVATPVSLRAGKKKERSKVAAKPRAEALVPLLGELSAALHAVGMHLVLCVPSDHPTFPYRPLGVVADQVVVLACRRSPATPGPLAAQPWFSEVCRAAVSDIPSSKLVMAVGSMAWDWADGDDAANDGDEITCVAAWRLARASGAVGRWNDHQGNPGFAYRDAAGKRHQVWMLDAATVFNQLAETGRHRLRGAALWRLGTGDPTLWRIWDPEVRLDETAARLLTDVPTGDALEQTGTGEILRLAGTPSAGHRRIAWDAGTRSITHAEFTTHPTPFVLARFGAGTGRVVLTFDDGPDPDYTPAILDILKAADVRAVFFVVGSQIEKHPELLDRIAAEGHEIGNHTFSHPNILKISFSQLELELAATQRLIESRTGRGTLLFRPPFGVDAEPQSLAEVQRLEAIDQLGYLTVGMRLDPLDWNRPGADAIVSRVVGSYARGDGSIVLMHDSGGDRSQTVEALPKLIAALRSTGARFSTVAELLGVPRDIIQPPTTAPTATAWARRTGFTALTWAWRLLGVLFMLGVVLGMTRLAVISWLALVEWRRGRRRSFDPTYLPAVTVIVPAYNEEKVVVQTVRSLLSAQYGGRLEIMVVDDGSKDATYAVARDAFAGDHRVQVLTKPNGGKSRALNFGIARSTAEIVVVMDADTVFRPDTVAKLARHFVDPRVAAVAGNAKVGNRLNLITRWQSLEYITCQNLDRRAFAALNCITVVPGAVGAWRRQVVLNAGGFDHRTLAEDADLTMTLVRKGYRVCNEPEAIARTEAPDTIRAFVKQRFRWMFGTLQAGIGHLGAIGDRRCGAFGWVALPNILIFQVFFPLISPLMDLTLLASLAGWAIDTWHHPGQVAFGGSVLWWYLAFVAVDHAAALLAFRLEPEEDKRLIFWLFLQRFFYRQLMYWVAIRSTIAALRGGAVGWGKLERKATVGAEPERPVKA